jgi:hypothetical protein
VAVGRKGYKLRKIVSSITLCYYDDYYYLIALQMGVYPVSVVTCSLNGMSEIY